MSIWAHSCSKNSLFAITPSIITVVIFRDVWRPFPKPGPLPDSPDLVELVLGRKSVKNEVDFDCSSLLSVAIVLLFDHYLLQVCFHVQKLNSPQVQGV